MRHFEAVTLVELPTVDVAGSVADYESVRPELDARRDSERSVGLLRWARGWPKVAPGPAIIAPQRAQARLREERQGTLDAAFAEALLHRDTAPTQTRNASDHLFWAHRGEFLTLQEQGRVAGVPEDEGQPLWRALGPEGGLSVIQATAALGGGVHCVAARDVFGMLLGAAANEAGSMTYASAFSGIDMAAAAFEAIRGPAGWRYAFAAEADARLRRALLAAWGQRGLERRRVYDDARLVDGERAVDVFVVTPECTAFSKRNHGRSVEAQAQALRDTALALRYVQRALPRFVLVENVNEDCLTIPLSGLLGSIASYAWRRVAYCPSRNGGVPTRRERCYWLGRRR